MKKLLFLVAFAVISTTGAMSQQQAVSNLDLTFYPGIPRVSPAPLITCTGGTVNITFTGVSSAYVKDTSYSWSSNDPSYVYPGDNSWYSWSNSSPTKIVIRVAAIPNYALYMVARGVHFNIYDNLGNQYYLTLNQESIR